MIELALRSWKPEQWQVAPDWQPVVNTFLRSQAAQSLGGFISKRLAAGAVIYPEQPFRALALTPLASVRVVIVGQDPYHGPGQAEGLAFSVATGNRLPPSLRNIFKELNREAGLASGLMPPSGSLVSWAQQGVLLLNTCLTVEQGSPASHSSQGWEALTDELINAVLGNDRPVVFMLWGAHAQKLGERMRTRAAFSPVTGRQGRHLILKANHPSPLSALRPPQPFIGSGHFALANAFLQERGELPVQWQVLGG
jgi:uracil-DNA glycosylase